MARSKAGGLASGALGAAGLDFTLARGDHIPEKPMGFGGQGVLDGEYGAVRNLGLGQAGQDAADFPPGH